MAQDSKLACVAYCIGLLFFSILGYFSAYLLMSIIASLDPSTPRFGVDLASIKSLNINGSKLTAEWDITLIVSNPNNKLHPISYDTVSIGVNYSNKNNQSLLATTLLNPFSQGGRYHNDNDNDNKRVQFNMDVNNDVVKNIADSCSRGAVDFGIVLSTSFKYKGMYDHFRKVHHLKVVCEPLSFITSEGYLNRTSDWVLLRGLTCH